LGTEAAEKSKKCVSSLEKLSGAVTAILALFFRGAYGQIAIGFCCTTSPLGVRRTCLSRTAPSPRRNLGADHNLKNAHSVYEQDPQKAFLRENTSHDVQIVKMGPLVRAQHEPTNKAKK